MIGRLAVAMTVALLLLPALPVSADHGNAAYYTGSGSGCKFDIAAKYRSGSGANQRWFFTVKVDTFGSGGCIFPADGDVCEALGSIETGFNSATTPNGGCVFFGTLLLGGTGHYHPGSLLDIHNGIVIEFRGFYSYTTVGGVTVVG